MHMYMLYLETLTLYLNNSDALKLQKSNILKSVLFDLYFCEVEQMTVWIIYYLPTKAYGTIFIK